MSLISSNPCTPAVEGGPVCSTHIPEGHTGPRLSSFTSVLDARDPQLQSERTQGFTADPVYGRAKCLPMLGSLKT